MCGLLLEFMVEETALCVERGWARLIEERDGDDVGVMGRERVMEGDDVMWDDVVKWVKVRVKVKRDG